MKKALLAILLTTSATGLSYGADLTKSPAPYIPQPGFSWSGAYIGGTAGYGWGDTTNSTNDPLELKTRPRGFIGGIYGGYNVAYGPVVGGLETDMLWSGIKASNDLSGKVDTVPFSIRANNSLDWLGTTRLRLGYAFGSVLAYGTGGLAYGGVKSNYTVSIGSSSVNSSFAQNFNAAETKVGWTAGMGLEYAMSPNALVRVEGLHYDLGDTTHTFSGVDVTASHKGEIVRAGAAYKF